MWTHLSRQAGGGIGLRGPGETQLEVDRRLAGKRIKDLKARLTVVQARKEREVKSRGDEYTVSLVGYTNAGKSRLMNTLTDAGVYVENKLFSTLDTRTRRWQIQDFGKVLLSDTVGFIRHLPHNLVASFKATLEESRQARMLLHVVDASSPHAEEHIESVRSVLEELGASSRPTLIVFNKVDKLTDRSDLEKLIADHPHSVCVSGLTGEGLTDLRDAVIEELSTDFAAAEVIADAGNGKVLAYLNAHAEVFRQEYRDGQMVIRCYLPRPLLRHVQVPGVDVHLLPDAKSWRHQDDSANHVDPE